MSDTAAFLRAWIADPLRVAAVAPSGDELAHPITAEIGPAQSPVIELGPGTGAFTRALIARGVPERDLVLVEMGSDFARLLAFRHPRARVLWTNAARLSAYPDLLDGRQGGAGVSGLPLLSMSARQQMAILVGCFAHLRPGAALYQFTYGPLCPVPRPILDRLGLKARRVGAPCATCRPHPSAASRGGRRPAPPCRPSPRAPLTERRRAQ